MKNKLMTILVLFSSLLFIILVFMLPDKIPVHWNVSGEVDGYGSKYFALIFAVLPLAVYYGMNLDKRIDPKKRKRENKEIFDFFRNGLTLFFILFGGYFLFAILRPTLLKEVSPAFIIGILLIGLGNYMPRIPQNYTLGVKTPWTLESEYVWKKTHRVSGYLFVIIGIITLLSSFLKTELSFVIMIISILISTFVSLGYSYILYKQEEKKNDHN